MTERISIVALRSEAEETIGVRKILAAGAGQPPAVLEAEELLALVEAVEAAEAYDGQVGHSWRCEYRTAAKGWKPGDPPVIECVCGLDRLEAALARFDFAGMT